MLLIRSGIKASIMVSLHSPSLQIVITAVLNLEILILKILQWLYLDQAALD